ncbi:MAG: UPF0261 family protein [Puniceicoccaceae bacterium]|nr:MAG: UPF0261 family protein [Puniceicoccaceae bacterium]
MPRPDRPICLIGAFDTKGAEYAYLRKRLLENHPSVLTLNTGILGTTDQFHVDLEADAILAEAGSSLEALRQSKDRGEAMRAMAEALPLVLTRLAQEDAISGAIGMGGTGGTSVITAGLRALPFGLPKICISTAASGQVEPYLGIKDIVLIPSIVDVAGLNSILRGVLDQAAGALCGMVKAATEAPPRNRPVIAASMFGNTTECVNACREALEAKGYEVLVFHATGIGGRTMEALVDSGRIDGVLDLTTTEWADQVAGGVFDAGPERLSAPGRRGVPHLVSNGCIDMVNFGGANTVPERYRGRLLKEWNPAVTLMRTNAEENRAMATAFAAKLNAAKGPVGVILPKRGVSILDGEGQPFCDWETDQVFVDTLRNGLDPRIPVWEVDANINDPAFAKAAIERFLELLNQTKS